MHISEDINLVKPEAPCWQVFIKGKAENRRCGGLLRDYKELTPSLAAKGFNRVRIDALLVSRTHYNRYQEVGWVSCPRMLARRDSRRLAGLFCDICDILRQIDFECDEPTRFRGTLALRLGPLWGFGGVGHDQIQATERF